MKFNYNGKDYDFPTSLSQITLRQRIDFDKMHGEDIKKLQEEVYRKDEQGNLIEPDEVEEMLLNISIAVKNFSFFTGIPIKEVEENIAIEEVLTIYHSCFKGIYEQQNEVVLEEEYLWNDEIWKIEQPKLNYDSKITFNELVVSKQIVKQMHDLGAGQWESMPFLAAIFLKREGEVFEEKWMAPNGERVQMMYDLPMDIAVAVGFFLQISMSLFLKTSQSLEVGELEKDPI